MIHRSLDFETKQWTSFQQIWQKASSCREMLFGWNERDESFSNILDGIDITWLYTWPWNKQDKLTSHIRGATRRFSPFNQYWRLIERKRTVKKIRQICEWFAVKFNFQKSTPNAQIGPQSCKLQYLVRIRRLHSAWMILASCYMHSGIRSFIGWYRSWNSIRIS